MVVKVLNSLGDIVEDRFSNGNECVEIKVFAGLKLCSQWLPSETTKSSRLNIKSGYSSFIKAIFSDSFKRRIRKLYNEKNSEN